MNRISMAPRKNLHISHIRKVKFICKLLLTLFVFNSIRVWKLYFEYRLLLWYIISYYKNLYISYRKIFEMKYIDATFM